MSVHTDAGWHAHRACQNQLQDAAPAQGVATNSTVVSHRQSFRTHACLEPRSPHSPAPSASPAAASLACCASRALISAGLGNLGAAPKPPRRASNREASWRTQLSMARPCCSADNASSEGWGVESTGGHALRACMLGADGGVPAACPRLRAQAASEGRSKTGGAAQGYRQPYAVSKPPRAHLWLHQLAQLLHGAARCRLDLILLSLPDLHR